MRIKARAAVSLASVFALMLVPLLAQGVNVGGTGGPTVANADPPSQAVPFRLHRGHFIVVQATVKGIDQIDVMIDTGANYSVIDRRLAKRLALKPLRQTAVIKAFGSEQTAYRVILPSLRLGPIMTSVPCFVLDLSLLKVDVILAMDVLRRRNFTLDFQSREMVFEANRSLEHSVSLEGDSSLVIVPVRIDTQLVRLALDTGARRISLFRDRLGKWIKKVPIHTRTTVVHVGGESPALEVSFASVELGQDQWSNQRAFVLDSGAHQLADGVLGVASLGMARIHFDFRNGLLGWDQ